MMLVSLAVGTAFAIERPDQEYRSEELEASKKLDVRGRIETEVYEFNNLDFRRLDETSDQSILDSDDRGAFAFTGASIALGYTVDPQVRIFFEAGHRGIWGDDQIGSVNSFGGFLYIPSMYAELWSSKDPGRGARFRVGRQFYQIGGMGGARDYVLADVLDMVRVDVALGSVGTVTLVPLNVFSVSADLSEVNFVSLLGQQSSETFDFRGDTLTRRMGGVITLDSLPLPVEGAAYLFYSDVGARGTGSDMSYDGALGNFSDNDWILNAGIRAAADIGGFIRPFAHLDLSRGIDRREVIVEDVDCNGFAYGFGVRLDGSGMLAEGLPGVFGELSFFDAYGPAYAKNGQQYSHGYVGMKGQQAGGQILNRFMGWHPTAYLGRNGVSDNPHNQERIAGARVLHAGVGIELPAGFKSRLGWWLLQDNGLTLLNFSDLDNINPPFGYSRAEFSAQRRLGQTLANEVNAEVGWQFGEHFEAYGGVAMVSPGPFYATVIDRVAGNALGSPSPVNAWAVYAGSQVTF